MAFSHLTAIEQKEKNISWSFSDEDTEMAKYELEMDIQNGKLVIPFESLEELETRLSTIDFKRFGEILAKHGKGIARKERRPVKAGLKHICTFRDDGLLEIIAPPQSKLDAIGLIMYAYDPDPLDAGLVGRLAGEKNPTSYLTHKKYQKYFRKIKAGTYALSHEGKVWVTADVIPKISVVKNDA